MFNWLKILTGLILTPPTILLKLFLLFIFGGPSTPHLQSLVGTAGGSCTVGPRYGMAMKCIKKWKAFYVYLTFIFLLGASISIPDSRSSFPYPVLYFFIDLLIYNRIITATNFGVCMGNLLIAIDQHAPAKHPNHCMPWNMTWIRVMGWDTGCISHLQLTCHSLCT